MLAFDQLAAGVARSGERSTMRQTAPRGPSIAEYFVRGAEIQHPQFTAIGDKNILRVDVSVHDAARVSVGESGAHVAHHDQRVRSRQGNRVSRVEYGTQQRSAQQLHGKKSVVAVAVEF